MILWQSSTLTTVSRDRAHFINFFQTQTERVGKLFLSLWKRYTFSPPSSSLSEKEKVVEALNSEPESQEVFQITLELPGLETKDINVDVNNNVLTIRGEKRKLK
jgi:HSP20 family molecular chaperone IbpA